MSICRTCYLYCQAAEGNIDGIDVDKWDYFLRDDYYQKIVRDTVKHIGYYDQHKASGIMGDQE